VRLIRTVVLATAALIATSSTAEAQNPEIYVPNYGDLTVTVLDAVTLMTLGPPIPILPPVSPDCPASGNPDAVQFTLDHLFAFVSIDNCDQLAVIDTITRNVNFIPVLPSALETRIFRRPQGDRMYLNSCGRSNIEVISVATQAVIGVILVPGSYPMAFSPNGKIGYAGNGFVGGCETPMSGIHRLDLAANTVAGFISTSRDVAQMAVHPSGGAALTTGADDRILVVNLGTNMEVGPVMCGIVPCAYGATFGLTFNAEGTRAYVLDFGGGFLVTLDTTNPLSPQELSRTPLPPIGTAFQLVRSGTRLYVLLSDSPSRVVVFDISSDPPALLPGAGTAGLDAFELDVWPLVSADQCKKGGWQAGGFKNQGQCVSSMNSKGKMGERKGQK